MKIQWAPKVRRQEIWGLYQSEARGIPGEEAIDRVGIKLLLRCESICRVSNREVECPSCGAVFQLRREWSEKTNHFECPTESCSWAVDWASYALSFRNRDLIGGNAEQYFRRYVREYSAAVGPRQKMTLIDQLLHGFRVSAKGLKTKSASYNLIEGNLKQVVALLDRISCTEHVDKEQWRKDIRQSDVNRRR